MAEDPKVNPRAFATDSLTTTHIQQAIEVIDYSIKSMTTAHIEGKLGGGAEAPTHPQGGSQSQSGGSSVQPPTVKEK
jgi:hypothetical protein